MTKFRAIVAALLALAIVAIPTVSTDAVAKKGAAAQKKKKKKKAFTIGKGETALAFEASFIQKLAGNGVTPSPIAPGVLDLDTLTVTFPISGGKVNKRGSRATVRHRGGFQLQNAQMITRTLTNLTARLTGKGIVVEADAGNGTTTLATLPIVDGRASKVKKTNRRLTVSGGELALTAEGAQDINTQFFASQTVFSEGDVIGTGKISARK